MNIIEIVKTTKLLFESGQSVMWASDPGMGKSTVALKMFRDLRDEGLKRGEKWGLGIIFAATQTPPDLIGVPFKGERRFPTGQVDADGKHVMGEPITITDPSIPLWMISTEGKPAFMYDKFFLLIEEYGQGEGDVKRASAEIFLNGGTAPWYLPSGSVVLGLTNTDSRDGVTKDFDFCIGRRTILNLAPDAAPLLDYADKPYLHKGRTWQVMAVTKNWIRQNPLDPFEGKPKQQGPWCNPRQLFAADRYLQLSFAVGGHKECTPTDMEVLTGTIGPAKATSYASHMTFVTMLPDIAEVEADPDNCRLPERADLKMLMAYHLASFATAQNLAACLKYIARMARDFNVTFVSALLRRDYKGLINTPPMQAWINKNAALVSIISSLQ